MALTARGTITIDDNLQLHGSFPVKADLVPGNDWNIHPYGVLPNIVRLGHSIPVGDIAREKIEDIANNAIEENVRKRIDEIKVGDILTDANKLLSQPYFIGDAKDWILYLNPESFNLSSLKSDHDNLFFDFTIKCKPKIVKQPILITGNHPLKRDTSITATDMFHAQVDADIPYTYVGELLRKSGGVDLKSGYWAVFDKERVFALATEQLDGSDKLGKLRVDFSLAKGDDRRHIADVTLYGRPILTGSGSNMVLEFRDVEFRLENCKWWFKLYEIFKHGAIRAGMEENLHHDVSGYFSQITSFFTPNQQLDIDIVKVKFEFQPVIPIPNIVPGVDSFTSSMIIAGKSKIIVNPKIF
jgi:hypothetical protein